MNRVYGKGILILVAAAALLLTLALTAACTQPAGDTAALESENANLQATIAAMDAAGPAASTEGSRLAAVRERGRLICASNNAIAGFGYLEDGGNVGFDIALCRAVAAAVLGDPNAVEVRVVTATEMGATLQSGEVDMIARTLTVTTSREAQWGNFAQTMYYDGQGFIVHRELGLTSAAELAGATICVTQGTTTELNLQDYSDLLGLGIQAVTFERTDAAVEAYNQGQCDGFTTDHSGLYAYRSGFADPEAHIILPETISEEPLGPGVPHGDEQWYDLVKAVMAMLIYAEAYGIDSQNVPTAVTGNTKIDRLFGLSGSYGQETLGLEKTAAQEVIRAVGNYGEIYNRYMAPLGLIREGSRNALWPAAPCTNCPKGGQLFSVPLR